MSFYRRPDSQDAILSFLMSRTLLAKKMHLSLPLLVKTLERLLEVIISNLSMTQLTASRLNLHDYLKWDVEN